jgi:hypothetical protein
MIVRAISLYYQEGYYSCLLFFSPFSRSHEEAIAKVAEGNVLKERS